MQTRFAALAAVLLASSVWGDGSQSGSQGQLHAVAPVFSQFPLEETVLNAPVSARITTRTVQQLYDGNRLVNESVVMLFRDSAGRVRQESAVPGFSPARNRITISDPLAGEVLTLDPANRRAFRLAAGRPFTSTFTIRMDDEMAEPTAGGIADQADQAQPVVADDPAVTVFSGKAATSATAGSITSTSRAVAVNALPTTYFVGRFNQPATLFAAGADGRTVSEVTLESLGTAQMNGVSASGQRRTTTYPVGVLGNELPIVVTKDTWYSPDLRMVVSSEEQDPRFGTINYSVEVLSTEEPDVALFEVPADYSVMNPVIEPPVRID